MKVRATRTEPDAPRGSDRFLCSSALARPRPPRRGRRGCKGHGRCHLSVDLRRDRPHDHFSVPGLFRGFRRSARRPSSTTLIASADSTTASSSSRTSTTLSTARPVSRSISQLSTRCSRSRVRRALRQLVRSCDPPAERRSAGRLIHVRSDNRRATSIIRRRSVFE